MNKTFRKGLSLARDNFIVDILNKMQWSQSAFAYNWLTTSTQDVIIFALASHIGVTTIQSKYLILLIITFII